MGKTSKRKEDKIARKTEKFWSLLGQNLSADLSEEEKIASFEKVLDSLSGPDEHIRDETKRNRVKYLRSFTVAPSSSASTKKVTVNPHDIGVALATKPSADSSIFQLLFRFNDLESIVKLLINSPTTILDKRDLIFLGRSMLSSPLVDHADIVLNAALWSYCVCLKPDSLSFTGTLMSHSSSNQYFCFYALAYIGFWNDRIGSTPEKSDLLFLARLCCSSSGVLGDIDDWQLLLIASFWMFLDDDETMHSLISTLLLSKYTGITQREIVRTLNEELSTILGSTVANLSNEPKDVFQFIKAFYSSETAISGIKNALQLRLDVSSKRPAVNKPSGDKSVKRRELNKVETEDGSYCDEPLSFEIDKTGDISLVDSKIVGELVNPVNSQRRKRTVSDTIVQELKVSSVSTSLSSADPSVKKKKKSK